MLVEAWNAILHSGDHRDLLLNAPIDDLLRLRKWLVQHLSESTGYPVEAIALGTSVMLTLEIDPHGETIGSVAQRPLEP